MAPRPSPFYYAIGAVSLPIMRLLYRPSTVGVENVPREGGFVLAANHLSNFDPWAIGLLESRTSPGPATLRHHDTVLACLRHAGFSREMTAHAYALIDSYVYGFALQEASLPFEGPEGVGEVADQFMESMGAGEYPHLIEMTMAYYLQPGYDFGDEFEFGLGVILDGLERLAGPMRVTSPRGAEA